MVNGNTCYMSNFAFILGYSALKVMQERNLTYAANLMNDEIYLNQKLTFEANFTAAHP